MLTTLSQLVKVVRLLPPSTGARSTMVSIVRTHPAYVLRTNESECRPLNVCQKLNAGRSYSFPGPRACHLHATLQRAPQQAAFQTCVTGYYFLNLYPLASCAIKGVWAWTMAEDGLSEVHVVRPPNSSSPFLKRLRLEYEQGIVRNA